MDTTVIHTNNTHPESESLLNGTELQGGRYRIICTLGRGGFGITYLADHMALDRKVCIKEFFPKAYYKREGDTSRLTLSSDGFGDLMDRYKSKFVKEARTIATLDHPNIIHIYDVFEENDTAYYVMDYIDGGTLQDMVAAGGAMSEIKARNYIRQLAEALDYIHSRDIIHLDVKPSNVIVNKADGRVILIDFGLSKHYDSSGAQTSTTPVGISHGYAPIEQYQDGGVNTFSPRTDIYSLGATFYYLVVGKTPPTAAIVNDDGLGALPSHLSPDVRRSIERAMQPRRKDRPASVKEFLAILTTSNPEDKPQSKKRSWLWLYLLLIFIIVVVSIVLVLQNRDKHSDNKPNEGENYTEMYNGIEMHMIWVDGGEFMMGSNTGEADEQPIHKVLLDGYWISETEVTQAQWEAVMNTTVSQQRDLVDPSWDLLGVGADYPMYYVNYYDALEFCRRLSEMTGMTYTLPTEAQWEYAALGGRYSHGYIYSGSNNIYDVAWFDTNSREKIYTVKNKRPNELGLYDMSGNVLEWCLDYSGDYPSYTVSNPKCTTFHQWVVVRGGNYLLKNSRCRVANRSYDSPSGRYNGTGFRVVCIPE